MTTSQDAGISRPKVVRVVVHMENPDGSTRTMDINPAKVGAIFWTDHAVVEILGGYYQRKGMMITKSYLKRVFGVKRADAALGNKQEGRLTRSMIRKLWVTPDGKGNHLGIMSKQHMCKPTGG